MKIVSAEQMREIDRRCAEAGLSSETLMENAGLAVAREAREFLEDVAGRSILVLVGPGNNGGDGLVAARWLSDWGARVRVYLYRRRTKEDRNLELLRQRGLPCIDLPSEFPEGFSQLLSSADMVIDALFGTGKLRPLGEDVRGVLEQVKKAKEAQPRLTILALDLPSGLDADTGAVDPACLAADITVTLGYPKLGQFFFPGAEKIGRLRVADIGIPSALAEHITTELLTADAVGALLPQRPPDANKGTFGRLLVVAGSINYIGAAYLACEGAMRVGTGLVTLATPRSLQPTLASKLTEVTYLPLPEGEPGLLDPEAAEVLKARLQDFDALLLGCGLGQSPGAMTVVESLIFSPLPALIDADGLNLLSRIPQWWERLGSKVVLTPHPGEMSRLTGLSIGEIQKERLETALHFAARWRAVITLKGPHTVISSPEGKANISPFINAGLASAGTGDVLSGATAGLMAQGLPPFEAASCGVYLHGWAGEVVREELGDAGMMASDLLPKLPLAIKKLRG